MALFTNDELQTLVVLHKQKRKDNFAEMYAKMINDELESLTLQVTNLKPFILETLQNNTTGCIKTTHAAISHTRSFDFSKAGGPFTRYVYAYGDEDTFIGHATDTYYTSYRRYGDKKLNRYHLWTSKDFTKRLGEALKLPEGMYINIRSRVVDEDDKFFKGTNVVEYLNTLQLVYRICK